MIYKPRYSQISSGSFRGHPRYRGCVGNWLFNEGGGNTAYDASGNSRSGALTNGPTWEGGTFGPAVRFNGSNHVINCGTFSVPSTELTICAWVRFYAFNGNNERIIQKADGTGQAQHDFMLSLAGATNDIIRARFNRTEHTLVGTARLTANRWHHVAATYNDGTGRTFLDGVEDSTATFNAGSLPTNSNPVYIGNSTALSTTINAAYDDIRLYNRELTAYELKSFLSDPFLEFRQPRRVFFDLGAAGAVYNQSVFRFRNDDGTLIAP